nr:hypothetical protein [uncultured Sphingomonas sp.]
MRTVFLVALLAATAAPTLASEPKVVVAQEATPAKEKMVCRRESKIGSNIPGKKVCVPKSQADAQTEAARQATREMQTVNSGASSSSN